MWAGPQPGSVSSLLERDSLSGNASGRGRRGAARKDHRGPIPLAGGSRLGRDRRLGERQNEFTAAYLESLPDRPWFLDTMQQVMRQPRAGVPFKRAGHYFVTRNDGSQNQDVTYVASSLEELLAGGRVLVDPNTFSDDGTSSLASLTVSGNGQLVAYGVSEAGSDWSTFRLLSLASGDEVDDALIQTKFSQAEWLPDHRSYVYTHFDHEGDPDGTQTAALAGPKLRLHRIGDFSRSGRGDHGVPGE